MHFNWTALSAQYPMLSIYAPNLLFLLFQRPLQPSKMTEKIELFNRKHQ